MKSKIFFISLFIGLMLSSAASAELNWSSGQTLHQVNGNITLSANSSKYIGAIRIYNIDISNVHTINITSSTYSMDVSLTEWYQNWLFDTPVEVTTIFKDKILNRTQTQTFTILVRTNDDELFLPNYEYGYSTNTAGDLIFVGIDNDQAYWKDGASLFKTYGRSNSLINNPPNSSYMMYAMPSKKIEIVIQGTDKVDIDYLDGDLTELKSISTNKIESDSLDWFTWFLNQIPFIGKYIVKTLDFLGILFNIIFSILTFIVLDLDILFLMVLSFAELHGIIIMAAGGTPFDGVNHPVRDILFVFKQTYYVLIRFFTLIWRIAQAISTIAPSILKKIIDTITKII